MKIRRTIKGRLLAIAMVMAMLTVFFASAIPANAGPTLPGWTEVKTAAELKAALEDDTTTQIIFGNNITLTSGGAIINSKKTSLVIDGNGYMLTDFSSNKATDTISVAQLGTLNTVTVQNMNISGRNISGTFMSKQLDVTFIYKSIRYQGPQFANHRGATVRIMDCDISLIPNVSSATKTVANAKEVFLEGSVNIVKENGTSNSPLFHFQDGDGKLTVTNSAAVRISNNRNSNYPVKDSGFVQFKGNKGRLVFENESYFNYSGNNMFSYTTLHTVTIQDSAQVYINIYGVTQAFGIMAITDTMDVNFNSVLDIRAFDNKTEQPLLQPHGYGNINFNNPREVFIYNSSTAGNAGGLAIGPFTALKDDINFYDVYSIEYWKMNKKKPDALAAATKTFKNGDNTSFDATLVTAPNNSLVVSAIAWRYTGATPFTLANVNLRDINVIRVYGKSAGIVDQGNIVVIHQDADTGAELDKELFTIPAGKYGPYTSNQTVIDGGYQFEQHISSSDPASGTIKMGETKTIVLTYSKVELAPIPAPTTPDPIPDPSNLDSAIDVEGVVLWEGNASAKPNLVAVVLYRDEVPIQVVPVYSSGDGKFAFAKMERYDASGNEYAYSVAQVQVSGYETVIDGFTIKNIYK